MVADISAFLSELLEQSGSSDLAAIRTSRLKALKKTEKAALGKLLDALDEAVAALDRRAAAIATGEAQLPVDPATQRLSDDESKAKTLLQVTAISDEVLATYGTASDTQTTELAPPKVVFPGDEPAPPAREFHEVPTVIVDAVTYETLADARPGMQEAPTQVVDPSLVGAGPDGHGTEEEIQAPDNESIREKVSEDHEEMDVRGAGAVAAEVPDATVEAEATTAELNEQAETAAAVAHDQATPGWTRTAELLFDDALRLFRLGDSDGALISLERLLASTELNEDLREFIRVNEDRLLDLYHAVIGPWEKVPAHCTDNDEPMPSTFLTGPKIQLILGQIDGKATFEELMAMNELSRLETIAVMSQLMRCKTITTDAQ